MRAVCRRLEGAFTLVAIDRTQPDLVVGARRNSPLVVGIGEGENFLASDVAAFVDHTRDALELGQDQVVAITADAVDRHRLRRRLPSRSSRSRSTGTRPPPRRAATTCSCSRRSPSSPRRSPTRCAGASARTHRIQLDETHHRRGGAARHQQGRRDRLRDRGPRRPGGEVRDRALDPTAGRGRARQRVPLPRPDRRPRQPRHRDLAVRRDDGHADGAAPREGAGCAHAGHLQHRRIHHPARVRRRALHVCRARDRGRLHQGVPHPDHRCLPRRPLPRAGARDDVRGRDPARSSTSCTTCRARSTRCSTPRSRCARWPASSPTRRRCCSSAATWATRWRWKAPSSSRSSPTCTPRASPPASSSTAPSP